MQTFLPLASFADSARALDSKRLANQVNEASVIYSALTGASAGWRWHPATRMWRRYEAALLAYRRACMAECTRRGIVRAWAVLPGELDAGAEYTLPKWFGWKPFHAAHRASLVHKDPEHYRAEFGDVEWCGYVWPVADHSYVQHLRRARLAKTLHGCIKWNECAIDAFGKVAHSGTIVEVWDDDDMTGAGCVGALVEVSKEAYKSQPVVVVERATNREHVRVPMRRVRVLDCDLDALVPRRTLDWASAE